MDDQRAKNAKWFYLTLTLYLVSLAGSIITLHAGERISPQTGTSIMFWSALAGWFYGKYKGLNAGWTCLAGIGVAILSSFLVGFLVATFR